MHNPLPSFPAVRGSPSRLRPSVLPCSPDRPRGWPRIEPPPAARDCGRSCLQEGHRRGASRIRTPAISRKHEFFSGAPTKSVQCANLPWHRHDFFRASRLCVGCAQLSAAMQDERKPLSSGKRQHTLELLARSRMFVDVYILTVSPKNAQVLVDGHAPEYESDGTLMFGFGSHTIEVRAPGMVPAHASTRVSWWSNERNSRCRSNPCRSRPRLPLKRPRRDCHGAVAADVSNGGAIAWLIAGGATACWLAPGYYLYTRQTQLDNCHNPTPGLQCTNESSMKTWRNVALA